MTTRRQRGNRCNKYFMKVLCILVHTICITLSLIVSLIFLYQLSGSSYNQLSDNWPVLDHICIFYSKKALLTVKTNMTFTSL